MAGGGVFGQSGYNQTLVAVDGPVASQREGKDGLGDQRFDDFLGPAVTAFGDEADAGRGHAAQGGQSSQVVDRGARFGGVEREAALVARVVAVSAILGLLVEFAQSGFDGRDGQPVGVSFVLHAAQQLQASDREGGQGETNHGQKGHDHQGNAQTDSFSASHFALFALGVFVTYETEKPQPRAVLVGVPLDDEEETLTELAQLAKTLGFAVVDQVVQRRRSLSGPYVLGEGKLEELKTRCESEVEAVIFDCELTPSQIGNLQTACGVEVLDRTGVIVEIFSRHARTREARLQVEIARLKYLAPRLRKAGRGPTARADKGGETGLELDRRRIRDRIAELKKELEAIAGEASLGRERRAEQRSVALVGYTNAGKSSLMRALTGSQVLVEDKLFATLDTTVRTLQPETVPKILISDTVGFIRKLPHDLVASFRSTLEEARHAWLLLYVVDASDPDFRLQLQVTRQVLDELGAQDIDSRLVLNKIDRLDSLEALRQEFPDGWFVSAKDPDSVAALRAQLVGCFESGMVEEEIFVPYALSRVVGQLRAQVNVLGERHSDEGTFVMVRTEESRLPGLRELARP